MLTSEVTRELLGTRRNLVAKMTDRNQNHDILSEYPLEMATEGLSKNYRSSAGLWLAKLSILSGKGYKDIKRSDILSFLDSLRESEDKDPLHKSTGTYNYVRIVIIRFLKPAGTLSPLLSSLL